MKAITLTQPWATLVAIGAKKIETRSWRTEHRGPIAIHAAKNMPRSASALIGREPFRRHLYPAPVYVGRPCHLPRGVIVATAVLVAVRPTKFLSGPSVHVPDPSTDEYAFGDYTPGRFMWFLEDVVALSEPVPARGALGLWEWTP